MMDKRPNIPPLSPVLLVVAIALMVITPQSTAFSSWTEMINVFPSDDPFRILEQTPLTLPSNTIGIESLALARADWKETPTEHILTLDVPGLRKEEVKIEVEENRVLRVSGERKVEDQVDGEKWHRAERANGKFWRQFRMPANADMEGIKARLEDGVLRITVPKFADHLRIGQPKLINIDHQAPASGQQIKTTKAAL